jgi:hypothetical protein
MVPLRCTVAIKSNSVHLTAYDEEDGRKRSGTDQGMAVPTSLTLGSVVRTKGILQEVRAGLSLLFARR